MAIRQVQYTPLVAPLVQAAAAPTVPTLDGWSPLAEEPTRRISSLAAITALTLAFVPAPSALEAPARAFYPDQIRRPTIPAAQQLAWAGPINPRGDGDLRWEAQYPDRVWRFTLTPDRQQAFAGHPTPLDAATPHSWSVQYPDRVDRRVVRAADQRAWFGPISPPAAPFDASTVPWWAGYPDRVQRPSIHPSATAGGVGPVNPLAVTALAWTPRYPDRIDPPRRLLTAAQRALAFYPEPITTVVVAAPELSWSPVYPARVPGKPYPAILRGWVTHALAPAFPVVARAWAPSYPDRVARAALPVALRPTLVEPVSPVAAVVVTALSWRPAYPDRIPRLVLRTAAQQAFAQNISPIASSAFVPLCWSPHYPDWLWARASLTAWHTGAAAPPGEQHVVMSLAWLADYPARIARAPQVPYSQPTPLLFHPGSIADETSCILLSDGAVSTAQLSGAKVSQPTLAGSPDTDETGPSVDIC